MSIQEKEKRYKKIFGVIDDFPSDVQLVTHARIEGMVEGLRTGLELCKEEQTQETA